MIAAAELHRALDAAPPLFSKLQDIYSLLPATTCRCSEPGSCCLFIPQITLLEALQWLDAISRSDPTAKTELLRRFVAYYLTNPVRHRGCPFHQKGVCSIYPRRSFACRAYGLWSSQVGQERTAQSRRSKTRLLKLWARLGLQLPPEVVLIELDYCDQVDCVDGKGISDRKLMRLLDQAYILDGGLADLQQRFETQYHSDFSFLVSALALGYKKALLFKMAVIEDLTQNNSETRLQKALADANWSFL